MSLPAHDDHRDISEEEIERHFAEWPDPNERLLHAIFEGCLICDAVIGKRA